MSDPFSDLASDYWLGVDALGAAAPTQSSISIQNVTPPSYASTTSTSPAAAPAAPSGFVGPSIGPGTVYTDKTTITSVQKKLAALGYYNGTVDGVYGPQTDAALFNYTGQHGPPNDDQLKRLGLVQSVSFTDDEVDSMVMQAKTATTPAQVQVVAAKIENLTKDAPDDVKADVVAAKLAAANAKTQQELEATKKQLEDVLQKLRPQKWPAWKIGVVAGGAAAGVGLLFGLVALARRR